MAKFSFNVATFPTSGSSARAPADPLGALAADCADASEGMVNAADLLATRPPAPDYIVDGVFETGSRVLLVGSSKTRKSFLALQLAVAVASGRDFVGLTVPRACRVLLANLENADAWQHRRLLAMCAKLNVTADLLGDRFLILNGRGKGVDLGMIEAEAVRHRAGLVICDPLYKLDGGADESNMEERKRLVAELETIGARTGAALVYVHHDAKGRPGDRDIRDRGAGSSIINRDVDATLALTPWGDDHDPDSASLTVLSLLSRNAPPQPDATLVFESGAFHADPSRPPFKATSRNVFSRRTPNGDPKADARKLAEYAVQGAAKTFKVVREHGHDSFGQQRTRRALAELYQNPEAYGIATWRNKKTGRGFVGNAEAVEQKLKDSPCHDVK